MKLTGSKIVVIGGSSGIGLAVARAALEAGAEIVIVGRSADKLERASASLPSARTVVADVTREEDVVRALSAMGPIDHVVVTAVTGVYAPIATLELAAARALIESKLIAAIAIAKHAPSHLRPHGSITFTSGIAKDRPMRGGAVVAAVNGALGSLARAMALELAPLRVNVVSPGWVDTPVWDTIAKDGDKAALWEPLTRRLPVGRVGTPAEVAQAYLFLMENEFATGSTVDVDGGHAFA